MQLKCCFFSGTMFPCFSSVLLIDGYCTTYVMVLSSIVAGTILVSTVWKQICPNFNMLTLSEWIENDSFTPIPCRIYGCQWSYKTSRHGVQPIALWANLKRSVPATAAVSERVIKNRNKKKTEFRPKRCPASASSEKKPDCERPFKHSHKLILHFLHSPDRTKCIAHIKKLGRL